MAVKMQFDEVKVMTFSPGWLVLGAGPISDPDSQHNTIQKRLKLGPELEGTVKRLIEHLKDEK